VTVEEKFDGIEKELGDYIREHSGRFIARLVLEPGYALRSAFKVKAPRKRLIGYGVALDILRLVEVGGLAYMARDLIF